MVVKTELCAFSEHRIYPGHGIKFVRKDGQLVTFRTSKAASLYHQKKKPAKLMWTLAWRRLNKKGIKDEHSLRRRRRKVKVTRAVVGLNVDEIKKRRNQRPEVRAAAREAALREVKERQKALKKAKKAKRSAGGAGGKAFNKNRGKR